MAAAETVAHPVEVAFWKNDETRREKKTPLSLGRTGVCDA
jgi:hypothetical protein